MTLSATPRYFRWLWLAAAGWPAGCSGAHEPTQVAVAPAHAAAAPTANVPALLGASIESLQARLGAAQPLPAGFIDPTDLDTSGPGAARPDSLATFRTGGLTLIASYNVRTRQVNDLLLLGRREDSLMARASLRVNSTSYLVLPVFCPDQPGHLLGLRVVATN